MGPKVSDGIGFGSCQMLICCCYTHDICLYKRLKAKDGCSRSLMIFPGSLDYQQLSTALIMNEPVHRLLEGQGFIDELQLQIQDKRSEE